MAEIKLEDTAYPIPENAQYDPTIRKLKVSDPAQAETVFNPLFQQIINNTHAVKLSDDTKAQKDLTNVNDTSVLEKVKKVDGSGSGLDADTVDGKHAIDLQNYNNLTNKPIIPTTLPANGGNASTVGGKSVADLQNYNNLTNRPDLKAVATSGNYNDLSNKPTIPTTLPANGGNADTVDGKHAVDLQNYNNLTNKPTIPTTLPANGGNADTVGGKSASNLLDYNNLTNKLIVNNQVGANAPSYDKVDFDGCNVDIISWYGLGNETVTVNL